MEVGRTHNQIKTKRFAFLKHVDYAKPNTFKMILNMKNVILFMNFRVRKESH
jgi:hypothetical protein